MNHQGTGAFDSTMRDRITADVRDLVHDTDIAITAVISTPGVSTFDPASGTVAGSDTEDTVTAYLTTVGFREVSPETPYQIGDTCLTVIAADLTTEPNTSSAFRVGDVRYAVVAVEKDTLGIRFDVFGRRTN